MLLFFKDDMGAASFPPMDLIIEKTITCSGAFPVESPNSEKYLFNEPRLHRAVLPAANGISNAHTLARIYALLIGDVNENGEKKTCLLSKKTLALATENVTPVNEVDRILFGMITSFARGGFQVHGDFFNVLGEDAFGHKGKPVMSIFHSILKVFNTLLCVVRHGWQSCLRFTFTAFSFRSCVQSTGYECIGD